MGDTVYAVKDTFNKIYSIELDEKLSIIAGKIAKYPHIELFHGDSGDLLSKIINNIAEPCLFWLDAHYSGGITAKACRETPIIKELCCILSHAVKNHCILIGDARCFNGQNGYPSIEGLKEYTLTTRPEGIFEVKDDIIRINFPLR